MPRIALLILFPIAAFVLVTWVSLESGGVVSVLTSGEGGQPRVTHIWLVESDTGQLLLEGGHPDNPWLRDLEGMSTLALEGEGIDGVYAFQIHRGPDAHERIRRLMREKYGWRDWWVGVLFDTSQSVLVALGPPPGR